ncbi:MAG: hypothetical protein ABR548_08005 [Actinomycetota bacterium]|nr:hypothetical protein [Actinomycetota bacterium]
MLKKIIVVSMLLGLALTGCSKKEAGDNEGRAGEPCLTQPTPIGDPKFPTPFPEIDDVTWSQTNEAGPSRIVQGFTGDALPDLFNEMKEKFGEGGYAVDKSERDPHDAEVNFSSAKNTGQVRLAEECQGRTSVTITIRPK